MQLHCLWSPHWPQVPALSVTEGTTSLGGEMAVSIGSTCALSLVLTRSFGTVPRLMVVHTLGEQGGAQGTPPEMPGRPRR